jgi:hypothetical protein
LFDLGDGIAGVALLSDFCLMTMMPAHLDPLAAYLSKIHFCGGQRYDIPEKTPLKV